MLASVWISNLHFESQNHVFVMHIITLFLETEFSETEFSELFYFYFQKETKTKRKQEEGGIVVIAVKLFIYFFYVNSFLYSLFTIIMIKCKVSFSSHSSSSHYSMEGFVFISFHIFLGFFFLDVKDVNR